MGLGRPVNCFSSSCSSSQKDLSFLSSSYFAVISSMMGTRGGGRNAPPYSPKKPSGLGEAFALSITGAVVVFLVEPEKRPMVSFGAAREEALFKKAVWRYSVTRREDRIGRGQCRGEWEGRRSWGVAFLRARGATRGDRPRTRRRRPRRAASRARSARNDSDCRIGEKCQREIRRVVPATSRVAARGRRREKAACVVHVEKRNRLERIGTREKLT